MLEENQVNAEQIVSEKLQTKSNLRGDRSVCTSCVLSPCDWPQDKSASTRYWTGIHWYTGSCRGRLVVVAHTSLEHMCHVARYRFLYTVVWTTVWKWINKWVKPNLHQNMIKRSHTATQALSNMITFTSFFVHLPRTPLSLHTSQKQFTILQFRIHTFSQFRIWQF